MRFIPHTPEEIRHMLDQVDLPDLAALFDEIPEKARLSRALELPSAASEQEVLAELGALAARNAGHASHDWFLGAGTYAHYVPAVVEAIAARSEFQTAYTPYQPEISQGTLQAIFEWQTMIAGLTGTEVANASLYDGASAAAEAALMALRLTRRSRVVVGSGLHPHYLDVVRTYLGGLEAELAVAPRAAGGQTDLAALRELLDDRTACVLLQSPAFLGPVEDVRAAAEAAHAAGALLVSVVTEALSLALLTPPAALGADIVCGEAQSFGVPTGFGGPHLGFLATAQRHVRQLPGRLVGETTDTKGRRGFVLTLATREQHIRRERATSNICTNQGLCLLMATVYLALHGPRGLRELAERNLAKAEYTKARVRDLPGLRLPLTAQGFNEVVVGLRPGDTAPAALARALESGAVGGLDLSAHAPELAPAVLVCTTELVTREAIDRLLAAFAGEGTSA